MKMKLLLFLFACCASSAWAQFNNGFPFGRITYDDLLMKSYPNDTSAYAVVLDEFGEAYIDNVGENNLLLEYHVKIKILSKQGLDKANFEIALRKGETGKETINRVEATSYNFADNRIKVTNMEKDQIFKSSINQYWDEYKFVLPEVQVGTVIEVRYILESPFIFNFYPWKFQSDIPKVRSQFWAKIPGNYIYNMSLKGFLKLESNESSLIKDCFTPGPYKADCAFYKFIMSNIPAFVEEDYMTARNNFVSSINYELSEVKHFDGRVTKYTKTWKDVDRELNQDEGFGLQIKKGKNVWEGKIAAEANAEADPLKKASLIYKMVKDWFIWNENKGKYAELGWKKAYESRKGNVGDINLSLVAALQEAGLPASPVILATRDAGLPNTLYPIISEFNYVVAYLEVGTEKFLLDATEPNLPFGLLPERCLNGQGRLISKKEGESTWVDMKPREKQKQQIVLNLRLDGKKFVGDMTINSFGYEALDRRNAVKSAGSIETYRETLEKNWEDFTIQNYEIENKDDLSKSLIEKFQVETSLETADPNTLYLNPFFVGRWKKNPFISNERLYPVDFGAPLESTFLLNLEYPETYVVDDMPKSSALALPQNGGRYLFNISNPANKIAMTSVINLSKVVYSSVEYHTLKELFNRIIDTHQSQIVFKKK
jgi:transglutaminase-like putative cysteine protease